MSQGFPDWQGIQQWFGNVLAAQTALAIGGGSRTEGPFTVNSWASIILWAKATTQACTFTVTQTVADGPATIQLQQVVAVPAGATIIQAIVLLGDSVAIQVQGGGVGGVVDYAIVPSNTTQASSVVSSVGATILRKTVPTSVANSIVQTDALALPLPVMGANQTLRAKLWGDITTNQLVNLRLGAQLGGVGVWDSGNMQISNMGGNRFTFDIDMLFMNLGVTNSQEWHGDGVIPDNVENLYVTPAAGPGGFNGGGVFFFTPWRNTSNVDTSVARTLSFPVTWGIAAPQIELRLTGAVVEIF